MRKLTHNPVMQDDLDEQQWFADLIAGMVHRANEGEYRVTKVEKQYGPDTFEELVKMYDSLRLE